MDPPVPSLHAAIAAASMAMPRLSKVRMVSSLIWCGPVFPLRGPVRTAFCHIGLDATSATCNDVVCALQRANSTI
jgi:hypothetical protein